MKTYKQQLTDLLCTVPEIEKQIKELKFGCKFINKYTSPEIETIVSEIKGGNFHAIVGFKTHFPHISQIEKIIGNPLEYHHLMMYCKFKSIFIHSLGNRYSLNYMFKEISFIIDNTKPLSEQSEEVYEQILIALNGLNL